MNPSEPLPVRPEEAWQPYRPGLDGPWDAARAAALHRRAGFGATWAQVQRDVEEGYESSVHRLLEGDARGPDGRRAAEFEELAGVMEESVRRQPSIERVQLYVLFRALFSPFPLQERMTQAWHGHYATDQQKVREPVWMLEQNLAQRALGRGPVSRLHLRMLRDPALLKWLDATDNARGRPNENLGREFLELFALGEGNYVEGDVRAVARALTGWVEGSEPGRRPQFLASRHDDGTKTILGSTGPWGDEDLVRIVCRHPAAALHIARLLYRAFVADDPVPDAGLLEPLAAALRVGGDVDVGKGIEVAIRSRLFQAATGRRVKSPVELVAGALRSCEPFHPGLDLPEVETWLSKLGQRLFYPPTVAGWPGGTAWLRGPTVLARANFAA
jgi:uncharacterized protein (DUF1800 family)